MSFSPWLQAEMTQVQILSALSVLQFSSSSTSQFSSTCACSPLAHTEAGRDMVIGQGFYVAPLSIPPHLHPREVASRSETSHKQMPLQKTEHSGSEKYQVRETDEVSCPFEHFSGAFKQDKPRVAEERLMCTFGLVLGAGRPNSHLHPGPVGCAALSHSGAFVKSRD